MDKRKRLEVNEWTRDTPLVPGLYWFLKDGDKSPVPVKVWLSSFVDMYVGKSINDEIIRGWGNKTWMPGWWMPMTLPEVPNNG